MHPIIEISLILIGSISLLILIINKFGVHPAIALIAIAFLIGVLLGLDISQILMGVWQGFYNIVTGIGIIILLGAILGGLMQNSGALEVLASLVLRIFGPKKPFTALSVLGFFVGIPVFCDSGFILLYNVAKRIATSRNLNAGATSLALAGGLYTTHTLIPPTPGPIAAAANLQVSNQLGIVMMVGLLVSLPILLSLIFLSKRLFDSPNENLVFDESESTNRNYLLLTPIVVALLLISLGSLSGLAHLPTLTQSILSLISSPVFALSAACIIGIIQVEKSGKSISIIIEGIKQAAPIILITACGGAFGQILKQSSLVNVLSSTFGDASSSGVILLLIAYFLALIIKTAQGSSTASLVITSSIMFPILSTLELSTWSTAVVVSAIGCGAMAVSHANDSYFWVLTKLSGLSIQEGYRKYSLMTLLLSITGLIACLVLFVLFKL